MELIMDVLLIAGAFGAALYCLVLSRRLSRLTNLETGVGGAIASLSARVDHLNATLETAQKATVTSARSLDQLTGKAEGVAGRLELLVASLHDLPLAEEDAAPEEKPVGKFRSRRAAPSEGRVN